jgi:hypothetical protein
VTVQLAFGATVAALQEATELVNSAGLFPPAEIFEMCVGAVPELVMATLTGVLARPCVVAGKVTELGKNLSAGPQGDESIPVPLRAIDWGLPDASRGGTTIRPIVGYVDDNLLYSTDN